MLYCWDAGVVFVSVFIIGSKPIFWVPSWPWQCGFVKGLPGEGQGASKNSWYVWPGTAGFLKGPLLGFLGPSGFLVFW